MKGQHAKEGHIDLPDQYKTGLIVLSNPSFKLKNTHHHESLIMNHES